MNSLISCNNLGYKWTMRHRSFIEEVYLILYLLFELIGSKHIIRLIAITMNLAVCILIHVKNVLIFIKTNKTSLFLN